MALREVNLIPSEILFRRQVGRRVCFWTLCLVLSLSAIFGGYLLQTRVVLARERSLMDLSEVDTNLDARIEQIKQLQGELETLHQKQTALRAIARNHPYSKVLLKLADIMNEKTWLTQLSIDDSGEDEEKTKVEMTGFSYSNDDLGDFLSRLAGTIVFQEVILDVARETTEPQGKGRRESTGKLIYFKLTCNLSTSVSLYGY